MLSAILHEVANILTWPMNVGKHGGYSFWSGIGSGSPVFTLVVLQLKHRNCHVKGCWSFHTHLHPDHGWPACRKHWEDLPEHISASASSPIGRG